MSNTEDLVPRVYALGWKAGLLKAADELRRYAEQKPDATGRDLRALADAWAAKAGSGE